MGEFLPVLPALAFTLTCFAYAWRFNRYSCKTFSLLWEEYSLSRAFSGTVEGAMIVLLLLSGVFIWIKKVRWFSLVGGAVMISEMLSETFMLSAKYPMLYWAEWALRYASPLAAVLLFQSSERSRIWAGRIIRFAIVLSFGAHGLKALMADPRFIDFLLVFFRRIGLEMDEATGVTMLHVIGSFDLVLAAHLLFVKLQRNRMILIWMAVWGAITALARITHGGAGNWHEVLIRSSHFLLPLTLLLLNRREPIRVAPEGFARGSVV